MENCFFPTFFCLTGDECFCRDWHGCIMAQSIVGLENVQPYKFSECSRSDYIDLLRLGHGLCLLNKPNEVIIFFSFLIYNLLCFILVLLYMT